MEVSLPGVKRVDDVIYNVTSLTLPFTTTGMVPGHLQVMLPGALLVNTSGRRYDGKWSKSKKRLTFSLHVSLQQPQSTAVAEREHLRRVAELLATAQVSCSLCC